MCIQAITMHLGRSVWAWERQREPEQLQRRLPWRTYFGEINKVNKNMNSDRTLLCRDVFRMILSWLICLLPGFSLFFKHRELFAILAQAEHAYTLMGLGWSWWYCYDERIFPITILLNARLIMLPKYWQLLWGHSRNSIIPNSQQQHAFYVLGIQRWMRISSCLLEAHKVSG